MKAELLYEGKAKKVYRKEGTMDQLVLAYKNDATAFNGKKKASFSGKGRLNNAISAQIFPYLLENGVETHFIEKINETEQLVWQTEIIPLEVVVRNLAAGSITKRLAIEVKTPFDPPVLELFYKDDALNDPLINDQHAFVLCNVTEAELEEIKKTALKVNRVLSELFQSINLKLVDFKLEFGRLASGCIVLADEISPDTCRLWDLDTEEKMDKDVFREDIGDLLGVYNEILRRLEDRS
ncbi:phosphoribosylaminoimidazolesuccinocarboxamide synthase [Virgibacillus dakarensis]|uniref:Phosphoribosylaminoimidazole-succinocarboxamide synthase n=1 Tax=Lentibacillus populi TaxID=1827502 RepID=A0A9W5TZQ8_9BACI|nr:MULTISPECIES: phosphoribosylaminoimidazolesuccinocarboxamide synthase [Bacillaceae]MTW86278.1 phosphoribosylaminoimidazolesuccinocarboxamide synthase [Virgibacillus dakarensis]GGB50176.1 phosphoribosylaminoimidazole-succinocarboxamide synthase [Lentibacillus populi]